MILCNGLASEITKNCGKSENNIMQEYNLSVSTGGKAIDSVCKTTGAAGVGGGNRGATSRRGKVSYLEMRYFAVRHSLAHSRWTRVSLTLIRRNGN